MIKTINVDLDCYTTEKKFKNFVDKVKNHANNFGVIVHSKPSKNGWHLSIKLEKPVTFWQSIDIRYALNDDPARMFYDIRRYRSGGKMLDTCFNKKYYKRKRVYLNQ